MLTVQRWCCSLQERSTAIRQIIFVIELALSFKVADDIKDLRTLRTNETLYWQPPDLVQVLQA